MMRKGILAWIAALATVGLLMRHKPERRDAGRSARRAAPLDASSRVGVDVPRLAMVTSLWSEVAAGQCRVPALYANAGPTAQLGSVMRLTLRQVAAETVVQRAGAAYVARPVVGVATTADAERVADLVTLERGAAAVVRVLRTATLKPRRSRPAAVLTNLRRAA